MQKNDEAGVVQFEAQWAKGQALPPNARSTSAKHNPLPWRKVWSSRVPSKDRPGMDETRTLRYTPKIPPESEVVALLVWANSLRYYCPRVSRRLRQFERAAKRGRAWQVTKKFASLQAARDKLTA